MIKYSFLLTFLLILELYSQTYEFTDDTTEIENEYLIEDINNEESPVLELIEQEREKMGEQFFSKPNIELRSRFYRKMQVSRGYNENVFVGNPLSSYQRFRIGNKKVDSGLLIKKDSGERSYTDFTNYFLSFNDVNFIKKIIIGDYIIESGQGVCFWRSYYFGKAIAFTNFALRNGKELQYYNSSDEIGFLRGVASHLNFKSIDLIAFLSSRKLTASIDTNGNIKYFYFLYYRTQSDLVKRNNTQEKIYGLRLYNSFIDNKIGITFYENVYSRSVAILQKKRFYNFGLDYNLSFENFKIAGEGVWNDMKYFNSIITVKIELTKNITNVILYRNYSPTTFNRFSNPFGENTGGRNEKGFFTGLKLRIPKYFIIYAYSDNYIFPYSKNFKFDRVGREYLFHIESNAIKKIFLYFRYRFKFYEDDKNIFDEYYRNKNILETYTKQIFRFNFEYKISKNIRYRLKTEYLMLMAKYSKLKENGKIYYHNITFKLLPATNLIFRLTIFNTDSYQSGIGVYENDLPGVLSNPILYGRGTKWSILIQHQLKNKFLLSMKYSYLIREDVKQIGSGWDQLPSNIDNRLGVQLDMNL